MTATESDKAETTQMTNVKSIENMMTACSLFASAKILTLTKN